MNRVFISYNHSDLEWVRKLVDDLTKAGIEVYFDQNDIEIGSSIIGKIGEAFKDVKFFIVCLSPHSVKSSWVNKEIELAVMMEINQKIDFILPLLLPGFQDYMMPLFLSTKSLADFRDPEQYSGEFQKLLNRISKERVYFGEGPIGEARKNLFVETANLPGKRSAVVEYLITLLPRLDDPTERYWVYVALGEIGGPQAESAIKKGPSDPDDFARLGAETARELFKKIIDSRML
jgi:hypothetical protein